MNDQVVSNVESAGFPALFLGRGDTLQAQIHSELTLSDRDWTATARLLSTLVRVSNAKASTLVKVPPRSRNATAIINRRSKNVMGAWATIMGARCVGMEMFQFN